MDPKFFEKLVELDSELVKGSSKQTGKGDSKLMWQLVIHSTMIKMLGTNSDLVKKFLKTKIGTKLVNRLLDMKEFSELVKGFFQELGRRFSKLQGISDLVNQFALNSRKEDSDNEFSPELMKIGVELFNGSDEVLWTIGAELIQRFDWDSWKRENVKLEDTCIELRNEIVNKVCKLGAELVHGPFNVPSKELEKKVSKLDPWNVQIILNVNEPYPDYFHLKWFSELWRVKILYLGRWQTSPKHHIEMRHHDFLRGLRHMKFLRFFGLQGISGIMKLPYSLCKLSDLRILDLRACHNLEELPIRIYLLKELTHLDISEYYQLTHMPKGIKFLSKLQVLKGFVISSNSRAKSCSLEDLPESMEDLPKFVEDFVEFAASYVLEKLKGLAESCSLEDLSGLQKLRKLNIYTNRKNFPTDKDVSTFHKFKRLQRLTITWGAGESLTSEDTMVGKKAGVCTRLWKCLRDKQGKDMALENSKEGQMPAQTNQGFFQELQKLDLRSYPWREAPYWLLPNKIPHMKKLYIRGGELQSLSPVQENDKWKVEILRLRFLKNLKIDWAELRSSFLDMAYVETFKCPELTSFPFTENGVWLKDKNIS